MTKKKLESEANTTYIHNHSPSYPAIILTVAGITIVVVIGLYQWIISNLAALGATHPGTTFFSSLSCLLVFIGFILFAFYLYNWHLDKHHIRRLELEDKRIERLAIEHRYQQSVVADTREINPHLKRRNALIIQLMMDAFYGEQNFSYRKAGEYILTGETHKVGKDSRVVSEALTWLRDNDAIEGNILTGKYTSIGQVQRALYNGVIVVATDRHNNE